MLREITKDVGRFKKGNKHDYPKSVWSKVEKDSGVSLDSFSRPIEDNPVLQAPLKRKPSLHKRLGATQ